MGVVFVIDYQWVVMVWVCCALGGVVGCFWDCRGGLWVC